MKNIQFIILPLIFNFISCKPTPKPTSRSQAVTAIGNKGGGDVKKAEDCYQTLRLSADITNTLATYDRGIHMFLDANCVSCHGDPDQQKGLDLRTFNGVEPNAGTILIKVYQNHESKNGVYPDTVKALFKDWKQQDYAENPFAKKNDDTTPIVSYSKDIEPFFKGNCVSCHNDTKTDGGVNLTNKTQITAKGKKIVQKVFENHNGTYSLDHRQKFKEWEVLNYFTDDTKAKTETGVGGGSALNVEDNGRVSFDPCEVVK